MCVAVLLVVHVLSKTQDYLQHMHLINRDIFPQYVSWKYIIL